MREGIIEKMTKRDLFYTLYWIQMPVYLKGEGSIATAAWCRSSKAPENQKAEEDLSTLYDMMSEKG